MLKKLYIKNFTLIDELDIELFPGFSVLTGETGAGKSIILGAIGLLLGQRADSKSIKAGADRCVIEAHFDLSRYDLQSFFTDNDIDYDAEDTIIRREITATKSRAFINDTPVALSMLKELGDQLVDIHSQHQNLLLNKQDFQLSVVDIIAQNQTLRADYQHIYSQLQTVNSQLQTLKDDIERNRQQADFMQFQYEELQQAQLVDGEQEELEQQSELLSHAEEVKGALYEADNHLNADQQGAVSSVRQSFQTLRNIACVLPAANELAERLESCHIELKDIADEVGSSKIYAAWHGEDITYIESPYSHMSITDFHNNVISIRNVYMGGVEGQRNESNSLHTFVKERDAALDAEVLDAIQNALNKIDAMPAPFVLHYSEPANGVAAEACTELSGKLDKVASLIKRYE